MASSVDDAARQIESAIEAYWAADPLHASADALTAVNAVLGDESAEGVELCLLATAAATLAFCDLDNLRMATAVLGGEAELLPRLERMRADPLISSGAVSDYRFAAARVLEADGEYERARPIYRALVPAEPGRFATPNTLTARRMAWAIRGNAPSHWAGPWVPAVPGVPVPLDQGRLDRWKAIAALAEGEVAMSVVDDLLADAEASCVTARDRLVLPFAFAFRYARDGESELAREVAADAVQETLTHGLFRQARVAGEALARWY